MSVSEAEAGGIFVSYRRQESSYVAGRLYDRLVGRFGTGQVFIDVDTIEPGVDFAEAIARAVETCGVLLAVIGPGWLTATDEQGRRRLDDPNDIVRIEIEAALTRNVRVIPILVENAVMPKRQDLPESLAGLARRNALLIRHESFRYDAERLITSIEGVIGDRSREQPRETAQPEKIAQPESRPEERASKRERWNLELVDDAAATKTFRLSSSAQSHIIAVKLGWTEAISVDGMPVVSKVDVGNNEYSLEALSSILGCPVTIVVERWSWAIYRVRKITLKIGDQVLTYEASR